ncbi:T9SS type A sorting domain-containing protein [bacterium]|nr:T9SS type A sorting domain-containing protein [bacterium]
MNSFFRFRFLFILCAVSLYMRLDSQVVDLCGGTSSAVMDGEYNVMNNIWGNGPGVGSQCLEVGLDGTYFKVSLSTHDDAEVCAYPSIFKGCHWGWCTTKNNPMPVEIQHIESAPFTWIIETDGVDGVWNAAFEAWFNETGTGSDYSGELMIWLDYHGGAGPAGSWRDKVDIGGHTWDVYFANLNWNYIAYKITSPADSVMLDLKDFIHDSAIRGYLLTPWYIANMEAGFEIWRDGEGLTSHFYSADVEEGVDDTDYAPLPFLLTDPRNRRTVDSLIVIFEWNEAVDPNMDPLEYTFRISGPGVDTTLTGLTETSLVFDGTELFQPLSTYMWSVEVTDDIYTTECFTSSTFKTPAVSVELVDSGPQIFSLDQNFPNPFNAQTDIVFALDQGAVIDLSVFNLRGEKLVVLKNGYLHKGRYRVAFDASDLPSGLYTYQLKSENRCIRKRCLYLK